MKNRVQLKNVKFHVDEVNKVVVCVAEVDLQLWKHPYSDYFDGNMWNRQFPNVSKYQSFTLKSISRCNFTDEFNVEKGKKIAETRVKARALKIATGVYILIEKNLEYIQNNIAETIGACVITMEHEEQYLSKLTEDTENI